MNKIKKILIGIFIIIIILIVLILVFYYINKNNIRKEEALKNNENKVDMVYEYAKQNNIYKTEENIEALKESIANRFKLLEDENKFFEINNIIQKYYENLILEKDQVIYDLYDKVYIRQKALTKDNMSMNMPYGNITFITPLKIYYKQTDTNEFMYIVQGYTYQKEEKQYIIIRQNVEKQIFSIIPIDENKYNEYLTKEGIDGIENLEEISNNKYEKTEINEEEIARMLLSNFQYLAEYHPEEAYSLIALETKEKYRLQEGKIEEKITKNIKNTSLISYERQEIEGTEIYKIIDEKKNTYEFTQKSILQYSVKIEINQQE